MSWLFILMLVVLIVLLPALTGIKPEGTRPTAKTRLMTAARIALGVIALILLYVTIKAA